LDGWSSIQGENGSRRTGAILYFTQVPMGVHEANRYSNVMTQAREFYSNSSRLLLKLVHSREHRASWPQIIVVK
jgi:hypothetical protein